MFVTKEEVIKRKLKSSDIGLCSFHEHHPDQNGIELCKDCLLIRDPCGCDEDSECECCMTQTVKEIRTEGDMIKKVENK